MAITRQTLLHVAELARLRLDDSEVEALERDLHEIVAYVDELEQLDTSGVEPTAHMAMGDASRPDHPEPGLSSEQALAEAPRKLAGGFGVPGFVDEP